MAAHVNQASFPEYILVTFGDGFPSTKGFYGLKPHDPMVLKKASSIAAEVAYTETGSPTASLALHYPNIPANRIKIYMNANVSATLTTVYVLRVYCAGIQAGGPGWYTINTAMNSAHSLYGWGLKDSLTLANFLQKIGGDATYTFMEVWNSPYTPTTFKGGTLATLEEYFPDVEVSHGTGGSTSTSDSAPSIGDTVTVTASPDNGYRFTNWTNGSGGRELSRDSAYTFTVPFIDAGETYSVRANFEKVTRIMDFRINGIAADLS